MQEVMRVYGGWKCIKQFLVQGVSMYRVKGITDFLQLQNEECTCFGSAQQQDEHFLAKHKTANTSASHQLHPVNQNPAHLVDQSVKNGCKKSLKRNIIPQNHPSNSTATRQLYEDASRSVLEMTPQKWRQDWQMMPAYNQEINERHKVYQQSHEMMPHAAFMSPQINVSHQFQYQMHPNRIVQLPPPFVHHTSPPLKVTFSNPLPNKTVNWSPQTASSNKIQPPSHQETSNISPHLQPILPPTQKTPPKPRQLQKSQSLQHIASEDWNDIDSMENQHSIKQEQLPKSPRKIEEVLTAKVLPENQKKITSRLSLNIQSGKSQLIALKKMDDVMQICSQAGSEEDSDSDESIVVGRLNEYCSMVEPKATSTITAEKSIQSKAAGLTSISSTISHCHFNRKKEEL